jgi:uncharacterized membrane protein YciS (DUF1049 family)
MNISLTIVSNQTDLTKIIQLLFTLFSFCYIMTSLTWIQIEIKRNNINRSLTNVSQQRDSAKVIQLLFTLFSFCSIMTSPTWIQIEIKRNNTNRSLTIVNKNDFYYMFIYRFYNIRVQ